MKKVVGYVLLLSLNVALLTGCRTYQFRNDNTPTREVGAHIDASMSTVSYVQKSTNVSATEVAADIQTVSAVVEQVSVASTEATLTTEKATEVVTEAATESTLASGTQKATVKVVGNRPESTIPIIDDVVNSILNGFNSIKGTPAILDNTLCGYAQAQANKMATNDATMPDMYTGFIVGVSQSSNVKPSILEYVGQNFIKQNSELAGDGVAKVGIAYSKSSSGIYYIAIFAEDI